MQQYIGTKIIHAVPATRYTGDNRVVVIEKGEKGRIPVFTSLYDVQEGYKVIYADGYTSFSPKDVFEEAYRPTDHMNFGLAIEALKQGKKISRKGWNGKGMFLFLADNINVHTEADLACVSHLEGDLILPSIVMKTADDHFCVGWLASQADMLADDWFIVD